jgi:hypothetical protein
METLLTIAIPTVEERKNLFNELYNELKKQSESYGEQIEIIYLCDNKEISIGKKRQLLNEMSNGKYTVQWDDDDWIHKNGVEMIMEGIKSDCDVISYNIYSNVPEGDVIHSYNQYYSIKFDNYPQINHTTKSAFFTPSQKQVIKTEIVNKVKFYDIRYQEDVYFRDNIKSYLKTEYYIDEFLYLYLNKSREDYSDFHKRFGIKKDAKLI